MLTVLSDDDVGVAAAVLGDVLDGVLHVGDQLHRALQTAVLHLEALGGRRAEGEALRQLGTGVHCHLCREEPKSYSTVDKSQTTPDNRADLAELAEIAGMIFDE